MDILFFAKTKEGAKIPSKHQEDAGYDIYACIDKDIVIEPHDTVMIPTGLATAFSDDYVMILKERGSTGTKGIAQRCGVIDSGFRGEIMVPVTNTTDKRMVIVSENSYLKTGIMEFGAERYDEYEDIFYPISKAIAQAVMLPVPKMEVKEISLDELRSKESLRGEGMLGSSGK